MIRLFFTGTTTIILFLALVRQFILVSRKQSSREDDKFLQETERGAKRCRKCFAMIQ